MVATLEVAIGSDSGQENVMAWTAYAFNPPAAYFVDKAVMNGLPCSTSIVFMKSVQSFDSAGDYVSTQYLPFRWI